MGRSYILISHFRGLKGKTSNLEIERFFFANLDMIFSPEFFYWMIMMIFWTCFSGPMFSWILIGHIWDQSLLSPTKQSRCPEKFLMLLLLHLIQLQRMIELVMCTHTGYLKQTDLQQHFRWYNIAVVICFCKYFVKLWQWCTMIWEFVMICIQCYFKLIDIYISDYLHSWLFYILPTSPDNKKSLSSYVTKISTKIKE